MSSAPRIVITGVGLHTGHGDTQATWTALWENRSALTCDHPWNLPPGAPDQGQATGGAAGLSFPAAPAPDPSPVEFLADRKAIKYMGTCTQMAVLAAGRALRDAGLLEAATAPEREAMALFVATGPIAFDVEQAMGSFGAEDAAELLAMRKPVLHRCHPLLPFKMLLNMPLGLVSIVFGIKGPSFILYPSAEQGGCALAHALRGLRRGRFPRALVGASACTLGLAPIMNLRRTGRLASSLLAAQPFGEHHRGWAPADQAAFLVLETEAAAARRGLGAYAGLDRAQVLGGGPPREGEGGRGALEEVDVQFCTGSGAAHEVAAQRTGWGIRAATLASADGTLGVAPAASFLVATALACLSVRQGRLPASLAEGGREHPVERAFISFQGAEGVAAASLHRRTP